MLDFDKFTNYSQEILASSSNLMAEHKNPQIEPEHIMLAMIKDNGLIKDYLTTYLLSNYGILLVNQNHRIRSY